MQILTHLGSICHLALQSSKMLLYLLLKTSSSKQFLISFWSLTLSIVFNHCFQQFYFFLPVQNVISILA